MDEYLQNLKDRMKISHSSEDPHLLFILQSSYEDIQSLIGNFDMNQFLSGKELVFERCRYAYNDSLEYFYDNFQQRILDLSIELLMRGDNDGNSSEL